MMNRRHFLLPRTEGDNKRTFIDHLGNTAAPVPATAISLVLGLPAAYSFAKYRQNKIGLIILVAG